MSKGRMNPFLSHDSNDDGDNWLSRVEVPLLEDELSCNGIVPKCDLFDCLICKSMSCSPLYTCTKGHFFCYRCAADHEFCSHGHGSEKIRLQNFLSYDAKFGLKKPANCIRNKLGCVQRISPKDYVHHVQFTCSFRTSVNCIMNNCKAERKTYWGSIDAHMRKFHGSVSFEEISPTCCRKSLKIPYDTLEENKTLTPLVLSYANARKFIPAVRKYSGRIYFWIHMIEDGYVHDYQYSQFHAQFKIQAEKPITTEGILEPVRTIGDSNLYGISFDLVDFEKKYLFAGRDPYFLVEVGIEQRKIVMKANSEGEIKGTFPKKSDIDEELNAPMKKFYLSDVAFVSMNWDSEKTDIVHTKALANIIKKIQAKRVEEENKAIIALSQNPRPRPPKLDINYDYYKKNFPDNTPKEAQEKEKALIEKYRQSAIKSGKLRQKDIPCLEDHFYWTAADVKILESLAKKGFSDLPTVQSGIYFRKFLEYQMSTYFSAKDE